MTIPPAPTYCITLDGEDITPRFNPRLQQLTLTDNRDGEADQLDITLTDHDGALAIPRKGVRLTLALGFKDGELVDKGAFIVDEVEHSGPPDVLTIRARSAELTQQFRRRRDESWHGKTLGNIIETIASRNNLKPSIDGGLAEQVINHIDQTSESDIAFVMRLGRRFDAVATVKNGTLLFLKISNTVTSQGNTLPMLTIARSETQNHRYNAADRDSYTGVRAFYDDKNTASRHSVTEGSEENPKELATLYADAKEAQDAAQSEFQQMERQTAILSLTLATGRPDLMTQTPVTVQGFKDEINAVTWLAVKVSHSLSAGSGLITSVELEKMGD
jgi:phage protein D